MCALSVLVCVCVYVCVYAGGFFPSCGGMRHSIKEKKEKL